MVGYCYFEIIAHRLLIEFSDKFMTSSSTFTFIPIQHSPLIHSQFDLLTAEFIAILIYYLIGQSVQRHRPHRDARR